MRLGLGAPLGSAAIRDKGGQTGDKPTTKDAETLRVPHQNEVSRARFVFYNRHREAEDPTHPHTTTPGRRSSWVKEDQKVWRCVSVSEDPPPPGDTL